MPNPADSLSPIVEPEIRERRDDERAIVSLRVDYKRLNTFFADYTKNISKGGSFVRTDRPLEIGTEFVFQITFPSHEGTLELRGKVAWRVTPGEATEQTGPAGMGIRFLFASDAERRKVSDLVEGLMEQTLGQKLTSQLLAESEASGPLPHSLPPNTKRGV